MIMDPLLGCVTIQDGAEDGSRVASSEKLCRFSYFCFFFCCFTCCWCDVVSITVYDRDTLLNIGSSVAQRKPDFEFLNAGGLFTDTASEPFVWNARLSANRITPPFCFCLLIGRNWNEKHPPSGQFNAGRTNRTLYYRTVLITWTGTCSGQRLMTT